MKPIPARPPVTSITAAHPEYRPPLGAGKWPRFVIRAHEQLLEAGVLSRQSWRQHPLRTALRLIPLRVKETVNGLARRPVFDLSFYLQFQPSSLQHIDVKVKRLEYQPPPGTRRRLALITPHLGPGGAESVLLDMARSIDRDRYELFLVATHSKNSRWEPLWLDHVDHVFDLLRLGEAEAVPSILYSLIVNWRMNTVVLQNTLFAYRVLADCKRDLPDLRVVELMHTVGRDWDIASATASVAGYIDTRVVISETARRHLIGLGNGAHKIRLIQNGVDLEHFQPGPVFAGRIFHILFAARLDPVKRPLLLVDIARALTRLQPPCDFRFVVAGDGPESIHLRRRIRSARLDARFDLRGYVDDLAPVLAESDVLLVTSRNEGVPLSILEAFAVARPVIASRVGAIPEILDENTGMLIDRRGNEAAAFADALLSLMNDPEKRHRMGAEARLRAEQHYDRRRSLELYRDTLTTCR